MITSPILVRVLEKGSYDKQATILAYLGYTWMAFIFLFFCSSVLYDAGRFLLVLISKKNYVSQKTQFIIPLFISLVLVFYGIFEARNLRIEKIVIQTPKLCGDLKKLRIVQISDLHIGLLTNKKKIEAYVGKIKSLNPDILVSTGDFVDGQLDRIEMFSEHFKSISAPFGKFAVTGNHEYYAGIKRAKTFLEKSGFKVLENEIYVIEDCLSFVGIDDSHSSESTELFLLRSGRTKGFTILLKHRPIVLKESIGLFDLQLSGHTHGGQIFPFRFITSLFFEYIDGYKFLGTNSHLYVSKGTGTWGPPVRVLSPPEITVIEIVKKDY
ncbi:MAG: metallophosphoesterase [Deltaproteobacteria bacterium]|nr:metallophosphoesterase [Deltaproteobacteria bacterium]